MLTKLKISTRLKISVGVSAFLLILVGLVGMYTASTTNQALKTVYEDRTIPMGQLGEINNLILRGQLYVARAVLDPNQEEIKKDVVSIKEELSRIDTIWAEYMATYLTPQEVEIANKLNAERNRYLKDGIQPTIEALERNDIKSAKDILVDKINNLYEPVSLLSAELLQLQLDVAQTEYEAATTRYEKMKAISSIAIAIGLCISSFFGFSIFLSIHTSIQEANEIAKAVANGNLNSKARRLPEDETAELFEALDAMQEKLAGVVDSVRWSSKRVYETSADFAQGNMDLSSRTENQASALEETAASMEQLGAQVKHNADNAEAASKLSVDTSDTAVVGGKVVADVVKTMLEINHSSRRVSEIISVIDGIAFQTNILALNAAVEAARAGENGRGFAVVASEVRSLAVRSADAAREIKVLINSSVERIEYGTHLADKAGTTMNEVVSGICRVSELMSEVSAASREQSQGLAQVSESVFQLDQLTQKNAALVEQNTAGAKSLNALALDMVQVVSVFKTGYSSSNSSESHSSNNFDLKHDIELEAVA